MKTKNIVLSIFTLIALTTQSTFAQETNNPFKNSSQLTFIPLQSSAFGTLFSMTEFGLIDDPFRKEVYRAAQGDAALFIAENGVTEKSAVLGEAMALLQTQSGLENLSETELAIILVSIDLN